MADYSQWQIVILTLLLGVTKGSMTGTGPELMVLVSVSSARPSPRCSVDGLLGDLDRLGVTETDDRPVSTCGTCLTLVPLSVLLSTCLIHWDFGPEAGIFRDMEDCMQEMVLEGNYLSVI